MKSMHVIGLFAAGTIAMIVGSSAGCGSSREPPGGDLVQDEAGVGPGFGNNPVGDAQGGCRGLQCQQKDCGGGGDTTLTGTVFAPNGKTPIYNAIVYVPNSEPAEVVHGVTCDQCGGVTGDPVVSALSQSDGSFVLKNVPVGKDIPLIIQVGKWRRKVIIPSVAECAETKLTNPEQTRLPKNQAEGSMPHIALTSGGCDKLGCMLPKVGIDHNEFGTVNDGISKAVHTYVGSGFGANPPGADARTLWTDAAKMKNYDMIILSCECSETLTNKGDAAFAAMDEYLKAGGRIFTTDFMYTWYRYSPDPNLRSATNLRGGAPLGGSPMSIDTTFPKGQALKEWLNIVIPGSNGNVNADVVFGNVISIDNTKSQQWASSGPASVPAGPRVFSVNMPVGQPVDKQCGKGVHIDAHVNNGAQDEVGPNYPKSCNSALKESENLLAFFFFDLASCIQNEQEAPKPPVIK